MMNKKILMGMLLMVVAFGMTVVGCDNGSTGVNDVNINYTKSPQVSSVTVTKTTNSKYFIISWDAVAGEANSYTLYFKQDGKASSTSISGAQNQYKYDPDTGVQLPNDNLDKWSARVNSLNASAAGSYCFGVRTSAGSYTVSTTSSDVKWSNSFTVTSGPEISTVTATPVNTNIIVTWDAIEGAESYLVTVYRDGNQYTTGSGQNSYSYSVDTGTASVNTDPSKWSFRSSYGDGRYFFTVRATPTDVSVLPSVSGNSNEVTTTTASNATQIAVASVTVTKTTNKQFFIISWDAVAGAGSYSLYFKQDGRITSTSISGAQNLYEYDPDTGDQLPNENLDKWSARISSLVTLASAGGSYCFGVRNNNVNDITWSDSFTVTNGPAMSAISVTKTTNESFLIASWDAITGVDAYNVILYYKNSSGSWSTYTNGSGQNSNTYAESDGNASTNDDPSKWSFRYNNITNSYECYFEVRPVVSDISVLPSVATSPIVK